MGSTFYGRNGETFEMNVAAKTDLDKLTFGLWDKLGIPRDIPMNDTNIIARMIRNMVRIQKLTHGTPEMESFLKMVGFTQYDTEEIEFFESAATFFEDSGGLLPEDQWNAMMKIEAPT